METTDNSPISQYDVLVFHAKGEHIPEKDNSMLSDINPTTAAVNFVNVLRKLITIDHQGKKRAPIIHRLAIGPETDIDAVRDGIKRSTFIFVPVTMAFSENERLERGDQKPLLMLQNLLQETFCKTDKPNALIPIFYVSKADSGGFVMPLYLKSYQGISIASLVKNGRRLDQIDLDNISHENIDEFSLEKISKLLNGGRDEIYERNRLEQQAWQATQLSVPVSIEGEEPIEDEDMPVGKTANGGPVGTETSPGAEPTDDQSL